MRELSREAQERLAGVLKTTFFDDPEWYPDAQSYFETAAGKKDLDGHVVGRTNQFRTSVIAWIDSVCKLNGSRILEIGCGTGSSTVVMAEQGAVVTAIDINPQALAAARERCRLYDVQARFIQGNVCTEMPALISRGGFDAVIFFAVLEHLTWDERMASLHAAWNLLDSGQLLLVIEAPNRLWHTDIHTSFEPFFMWLPDQAAIEYSRFTPRDIFNAAFRGRGEAVSARSERLARWGRGVSYHEFEIAFDIPAERLPVASAMRDFHHSAFKRLISRYVKSGRYMEMLRQLKPAVHPAFFAPSIDLAFRKS